MFQTEHYFDLTGGLSYLSTVGLAYAVHPGMDSRGMILCLMVAVWSARLGTFLFLRVKRAGQDRRFTEIKKKFFRYAFTWTSVAPGCLSPWLRHWLRSRQRVNFLWTGLPIWAPDLGCGLRRGGPG